MDVRRAGGLDLPREAVETREASMGGRPSVGHLQWSIRNDQCCFAADFQATDSWHELYRVFLRNAAYRIHTCIHGCAEDRQFFVRRRAVNNFLGGPPAPALNYPEELQSTEDVCNMSSISSATSSFSSFCETH